jgi:hypothetical protein
MASPFKETHEEQIIRMKHEFVSVLYIELFVNAFAFMLKS